MGGGIPVKGIVGGIIAIKRVLGAGGKIGALSRGLACKEDCGKEEKFFHGGSGRLGHCGSMQQLQCRGCSQAIMRQI